MLQSTWTNGCTGATKLSRSIVTESAPSSWSHPCGRWCSLSCCADMKRFKDKITGLPQEQHFQVFGGLEKDSPFTTPLIYRQHPTWNKSETQIWARLPQLPRRLPIRISCQVTLTAVQLLSMFTTTHVPEQVFSGMSRNQTKLCLRLTHKHGSHPEAGCH